MKNLQQELIDFKNWWNGNCHNNFTNIRDRHIDDYIKSINSNSAGERRAIGSNEQAEEVCYHEWDEGYHNVSKCKKCGKYSA